jgi:hypothetical protein
MIHGGVDTNLGSDETIAIGYSDYHRHDDDTSNCKGNTRPNSWLMHRFTHVINSSQFDFNLTIKMQNSLGIQSSKKEKAK